MSEYTSLELSKRLYEKGFRGEHKKVWIKTDGEWIKVDSEIGYGMFKGAIPAYTFTEIWLALPKEIEHEGKLLYIRITCGRKGMFIEYSTPDPLGGEVYFSHASPAEVVGLLLEWCIDNGHVEVSV